MRHLHSVLALGLVLLVFSQGQAADRNKALVVIDDAIRAHGGAEKLAATRIMTRSSKGTMHLFGKENAFKAETAFQLPDRYRDAIVIETDGLKAPLTIVVNGDQGWNSSGGMVSTLGKSRIAEVREEMLYVVQLSTLLPLRDKTFELAPLPESKVLGLPALAVKVTSKGHSDAVLYFDKESRLLIKLERKAQEGGLGFHKEYYYREHRDFDGLKMPTRYIEIMNGKKLIELTIESYKFPQKIDEKVFGKP